MQEPFSLSFFSFLPAFPGAVIPGNYCKGDRFLWIN
nr:MAG TPA: hypothetical protein [Caudoviricetes sp.]